MFSKSFLPNIDVVFSHCMLPFTSTAWRPKLQSSAAGSLVDSLHFYTCVGKCYNTVLKFFPIRSQLAQIPCFDRWKRCGLG